MKGYSKITSLERSKHNKYNANIELEHLKLELCHGRTNHARHFIDQYFFFKHGYVNRNGNADWEKIVWTGNVSLEAELEKDRSQVVKEHSVPIKVIRNMLFEHSEGKNISTQSIADILDKYVHFATITKKEDKRLREAQLNSTMPKGWCGLSGNVFARYKAVNIQILHVT